MKRWIDRDRATHRVYMREYRKKNLERMRAYELAYYHRKKLIDPRFKSISAKRKLAVQNGDHELWAKLLLNVVKYRSKKRGIEFNLSYKDIVIPALCPVLGIPLRIGRGRGLDDCASIDRIDPNGGYTKDNIIVVSVRANMIKTNASPDEILKVGNFYKHLLLLRAQKEKYSGRIDKTT
jgi:hypothetical protein